MRRGTTPTLVFTVDPVLDLSTLAEAWLTIYQAGEVATKTLPELTQTENGFSVTLTQDETLRLCAGAGCRIQLRAATGQGAALASNILRVPVAGILKDGIIGAETGEGDAAARQQDAGADDPADSVAPLPLTLDPAEVQLTLALDAVETGGAGGAGGAGSWGIGAGLKVVDGKLTVDTADAVEQDNTLPVTSAAVYVQTGNIEALLAAL